MNIFKRIFCNLRGKTRIAQSDKSTFYLDNNLTINFCIDVANKLEKDKQAVFYFKNGERLELKTIDNVKIKKRVNWGGE